MEEDRTKGTNLTLDINGVCNARCKFCYQTLDGEMLPNWAIIDAVDKASNVKIVEIGGGEPLIDPRISYLTREIIKRGKGVHISTNACSVSDTFLNLEEEIRNNIQMQISVHGSNRELYREIHGCDSFDRVLHNVGMLKERFDSLLTSAIYKGNYRDVPNLISLAERFEIPIRINLVFPIGKGKGVDRLSAGEVDKLRGYLLGQKLKGRNVHSPLISPNNCYALEEAYGLERNGMCPLDCGKKYISPNGETRSCEFVLSPEVVR